MKDQHPYSSHSHQYDDIITRPHHVSSSRPQMSLQNRAAQFSPFAALTGYDTQIKEAARLTNVKPDLSETEKEQINEKLQIIQAQLAEGPGPNYPSVSITYFCPDDRKEGGAYVTVLGQTRKINLYEKTILLYGTRIDTSSAAPSGSSDPWNSCSNAVLLTVPIDDILEIHGEIFQNTEPV